MSRSPVGITPGSPEHSRLISPSKAAAILGVSRWQSRYSIWHEMRGNHVRQLPSDLTDVGYAFEAALAELWKRENPQWRLSPGEVQFVGDEYGFPYVCTLDRRATRGRDRRVVELKTARSLEEFGDPNLDGDCPTDYSAQCLAQMLFAGQDYRKHPAHLMVMGPFFRHRTYLISYDQLVVDWIIRECQRFWSSLINGDEPDLDDSVATYTCVRAMHPDITPGLSREIPEALAEDLITARANWRTAERTLRGLKSKVLDAVGEAQYVTVNGEVVADRRPHAKGGVALNVR